MMPARSLLSILALLTSCAPAAVCPPVLHPVVRVKAPAARTAAQDYRRADAAAFTYVAGPLPDTGVIQEIRTLEAAVRFAQRQGRPADARAAVDGFMAYLAAHGIQ